MNMKAQTVRELSENIIKTFSSRSVKLEEQGKSVELVVGIFRTAAKINGLKINNHDLNSLRVKLYEKLGYSTSQSLCLISKTVNN